MDTFEKYLWSKVTGDIKDIAILTQSFCKEDREAFLFAVSVVMKIAKDCLLNPYTYLILSRSFYSIIDDKTINKAVLLEFCRRHDKRRYNEAYKVLELGGTNIMEQLNDFLQKIDKRIKYLTPQFAKLEE